MTRDHDPPDATRGATAFDPALYDADFFVWTQRQAAALRALPRHPAAAAAVDIERVAVEIEDMGKRDLREVGSFLARLIEHLLKLDAAPSSRDAAHWWSEAAHFQNSAVDAYTSGMRHLVDNQQVWARGCRSAKRFFDDRGEAPALPAVSPFTLDELLAENFDFEGALARLAAARDTPRA